MNWGTPFRHQSPDLIVLDTRDVANSSVVSTVNKGKRIGQDSLDALVESRLVKRETIHKNNLP